MFGRLVLVGREGRFVGRSGGSGNFLLGGCVSGGNLTWCLRAAVVYLRSICNRR